MAGDLEFIVVLMDDAYRDRRLPRALLQQWANMGFRAGVLPYFPGGKTSRRAFVKLIGDEVRSHFVGQRSRKRARVDAVRLQLLNANFDGRSDKQKAKIIGCTADMIRRAEGRKK